MLTPYPAISVMPEPPDARTDPLDEFILVDEASNLSQTTAEGHRPVDVSSAVFRYFYDFSAMLTPLQAISSPPRPLKRGESRLGHRFIRISLD